MLQTHRIQSLLSRWDDMALTSMERRVNRATGDQKLVSISVLLSGVGLESSKSMEGSARLQDGPSAGDPIVP
jgi:hypothetical protein